MLPLVDVAIHPSQFPERVRRDLLDSLRARQVNHKFHYDSLKQTQKWLALHQAYSPSRTDPDCAAIYDRAFAALAPLVGTPCVHVLGLGCGGGQKDTRLLQRLKDLNKDVFYTPSDVSTAMVLVARQAALAVVPAEHCDPLVCDLATADDLAGLIELRASSHGDGPVRPETSATRLVTFFGMLPNFEPHFILPRLASFVRPADYLLLSANLAPGPDYSAGVQRVLPLYDNALTRDWLLTFLLDLGVELADGHVRFAIETVTGAQGLKCIAAYFQFERRRKIEIDAERFQFESGESLRLFFSCRHTPALVRGLLDQYGLRVLEQWTTRSEEEGVFLVRAEAPVSQ